MLGGWIINLAKIYNLQQTLLYFFGPFYQGHIRLQKYEYNTELDYLFFMLITV